MFRSPKRRCGFTLVEMLVVIGIIGLLMAILMPALGGVKKRSRKANELNNIRQINFAWNAYAAANESAAVPAYLDPAGSPNVFDRWDLFYEFPNHATIPEDVAAPWTWRLMQYLDYNHEIIHSYREEDDPSLDNMILEAVEVANEPAFGYNGYYTGGWWSMTVLEPPNPPVPLPRFYAATDLEGKPISVVVKSLGQIQRQSDYITFCSSSEMIAGLHKQARDNAPGSFLVVPPTLADVPQWEGYIEVNALNLLENTHAPIGRYTGAVAVLFADGHADSQAPSRLDDARMWINVADTPDFSHLP
ncbi:MAG: type II secretion system protein [Phycisphaerales bacterium]|nr:MAG: type II secretion system protein [Phycisphaerales bacterium]